MGQNRKSKDSVFCSTCGISIICISHQQIIPFKSVLYVFLISFEKKKLQNIGATRNSIIRSHTSHS